MKPGAQVYLWAVVALALAAIALYTPKLELTGDSLIVLVLFSLIALASQIYEVEITYRNFISAAVTVAAAAIFIGGAPLAIWVVLLSTLPAEITLRYDKVRHGRVPDYLNHVAFNVGQLVLAVTIASGVYALLGGHPPPWRTAADFIPPIITFLVCVAANTALVSGIIALTEGVSFTYQFTFDMRYLPVQFLSLGVLAILLAVLYSISPWYMLLALIPLGLVHYSLWGYTRLRRGATETFEKLLDSLAARDPSTAVHSEHVADLSERIARALGLPEDEVDKIKSAARIHDIGKIGIPDSILLKPGPLTEGEWEIMKRHPLIGADILKGLEVYDRAIDIVRHEHERWDGSGYPDGLRGTAIPLGARIVAVADVYDALISDRPYRKAFPREKALEMIREMRGTKLDPEVVDALFRVLEEGKS